MMTDFRFAARNITRTPGFTALVVLTLALGIGASTAIFSLINGVLLRPLDYQDSERLVRLWSYDRTSNFTHSAISYPRFDLIRSQQDTLVEIVANTSGSFTLTGNGPAEQISGEQVSAQFFHTLGVRLLHGRSFLPEEDTPTGHPVVVLGYGLWARSFGADPRIVGTAINLNGTPHTVIGVLPADFTFPYSHAELWTTKPFEPLGYNAQQVRDGAVYLNVTARLKPGVTFRQAEEQVVRLSEVYSKQFPDRVDARTSVEVMTFKEELVGQQRPAFYTLLGAVGLVHLIACANIANLLLARFNARRRETAMRIALGAGRARLIWQFVFESLLLSLAAGVLGTLLASGLVGLCGGVLAEILPRPLQLGVDVSALLFTLGLALGTGIAVGFFPAVQASRTDLLFALKESARGSTLGAGGSAFRRTLLVGEVAVSLVLLISAGLVALSFLNLSRIDPGFRTAGIFLADFELPHGSYDTSQKQLAFANQLLAKLAPLPGVAGVALTDSSPLAASPVFSPYAAAGRPLPPMSERLTAIRHIITPGYFSTIGIRLVQGRDFTAREPIGSNTVAILNETAARTLFPGEDPLGKKIILGITDRTAEVVGVVADIHAEALVVPPRAEVYFSFRQRPKGAATLVLRTSDPPAILAPTVRGLLQELDREVPLIRPRIMADIFSQSLADRRLSLVLLTMFAATALVLATLGIYSVVAYSVLQRTDEIGIRMVLGATPGAMQRMIVGQSMRLTLVGLGAGLLASYYLTKIMARLLFDIRPLNLPVYLGIAAFLGLVALMACWLPARRASRIDPVTALRAE